MNTKIIIVAVTLLVIVAVGLQYYLNNYGGAAVFQGGTGGDQAACSGICQDSCSSFSNPTDTQQCLQECAQFCAEGY